MKTFKADLHVHTLLSPCGHLEMSPRNLILRAAELGLEIIAITDHNTVKHCELVAELAKDHNIMVIPGCETTTSEEVHCLSYFETIEIAQQYEDFLNDNYLKLPNDSKHFGYQVVLDKDENIIEEVDHALIMATDLSISDVATKTHELGGVFIPAHIERPGYGLLRQLGFVPDDLEYDALEISYRSSIEKFKQQNPTLADKTMISNSDSHHPEHLARAYNMLRMEKASFEEFKLAIQGRNERSVEQVINNIIND
ncbi:PHP domain-containing protein [Bacteroidales bacterium]|nr:PHP domain-containing protein [Bacteroidales bacterium]